METYIALFNVKLFAEYGVDELYQMDRNRPLPTDLPPVLVMKIATIEFSSWKAKDDDDDAEALSPHIGALFKSFDRYRSRKDFFADTLDSSIDSSYALSTINQLKAELEARIETTDVHNIPNALTCREFITPYLIAAIRLAQQYIKVHHYANNLSLLNKKFLVGKYAHGIVDSVIAVDYIDIVVTITKEEDCLEVIVQNLLQQQASLQFLSAILFDAGGIVGVKRSRKEHDLFDELHASTPTFGIVSNGREWIFTKCHGVQGRPMERTSIQRSCTNCILYTADYPNNTRDDMMKTILFTITNMIIMQVENAQKNPVMRKIRDIFANPIQLFSCQYYESQQLQEELAALNEEEELEEDEAEEDDVCFP
jgi:hypothetical protein